MTTYGDVLQFVAPPRTDRNWFGKYIKRRHWPGNNTRTQRDPPEIGRPVRQSVRRLRRQFNKFGRNTGMNRHGDFISFNCLWAPNLERTAKPAVAMRTNCGRDGQHPWGEVDSDFGRKARRGPPRAPSPT